MSNPKTVNGDFFIVDWIGNIAEIKEKELDKQQCNILKRNLLSGSKLRFKQLEIDLDLALFKAYNRYRKNNVSGLIQFMRSIPVIRELYLFKISDNLQ